MFALSKRFAPRVAFVSAGAALLILTVSSLSRGSVVDLRGTVTAEPDLIHHYTFEGANDLARLADQGPGAADLSVVSYGTGSSTIGTATGVSFSGPAWDGTSTSLTPYNDGQGFSSGGAGLSTVAPVALPASMTVEAIFRPLAAPSGSGYGVATRQASDRRGYYLYQGEGDRLATIVGDDFSQPDNDRTVLRYFRPGDWYYLVNTYEQSGGNTQITSYVANLSQGDTGLSKALEGVVASSSYGSSAPLGIGIADFTPIGQGYQRGFDGQLDEVAIYGAALDQAAAQRHYDALRRVAGSPPPVLTGHWTFDSDFTDSVGANHGTATGATIDAAGRIGGAASFDGNDDRVVVPREVLPDGTFSIAFWEFAPDPSGTNTGYMVGAGSGPGFDELFLRRYGSPAELYAGGITQDLGQGHTLGEPGPVARDRWHHHVLTHDASGQGRWYIDGVPAAAQPGSTFGGLAHDLFLGNRADLARDFLGKLDDLQVYDRPLTSTQAAALTVMPGFTLDQLILATMPVANGSFESPDVPPHENGIVAGVPIAGWYESASAGPGQDGPNSHPMNPAEHDGGKMPAASRGEQVANLVLRDAGVTDTWIFQSLGVIDSDDVGKMWMLQVDVAARADQQGGALARAAFATDVTVGDQGVNVGDMLSTSYDMELLPGEGWQGLLETLTIDTGLVGQEVWLRLSVHDPLPPSDSSQYFFDDVRLAELARVPEPATWVLLALGLAASIPLLGRRRPWRRGTAGWSNEHEVCEGRCTGAK